MKKKPAKRNTMLKYNFGGNVNPIMPEMSGAATAATGLGAAMPGINLGLAGLNMGLGIYGQIAQAKQQKQAMYDQKVLANKTAPVTNPYESQGYMQGYQMGGPLQAGGHVIPNSSIGVGISDAIDSDNPEVLGDLVRRSTTGGMAQGPHGRQSDVYTTKMPGVDPYLISPREMVVPNDTFSEMGSIRGMNAETYGQMLYPDASLNTSPMMPDKPLDTGGYSFAKGAGSRGGKLKGYAKGGPLEFGQAWGQAAESAAQQLQIPKEFLLSQWGLETGWGDSIIGGTNNAGNIKAGSSWTGPTKTAHDSAEGSNDPYRVYDSPEAFATDYVNLIKNNYPGAVGAKSIEDFGKALQSGGYATDPQYSNKLSNVYSSNYSTPPKPTQPYQPMLPDGPLGQSTMEMAGLNYDGLLGESQFKRDDVVFRRSPGAMHPNADASLPDGWRNMPEWSNYSEKWGKYEGAGGYAINDDAENQRRSDMMAAMNEYRINHGIRYPDNYAVAGQFTEDFPRKPRERTYKNYVGQDGVGLTPDQTVQDSGPTTQRMNTGPDPQLTDDQIMEMARKNPYFKNMEKIGTGELQYFSEGLFDLPEPGPNYVQRMGPADQVPEEDPYAGYHKLNNYAAIGQGLLGLGLTAYNLGSRRTREKTPQPYTAPKIDLQSGALKSNLDQERQRGTATAARNVRGRSGSGKNVAIGAMDNQARTRNAMVVEDVQNRERSMQFQADKEASFRTTGELNAWRARDAQAEQQFRLQKGVAVTQNLSALAQVGANYAQQRTTLGLSQRREALDKERLQMIMNNPILMRAYYGNTGGGSNNP